MHGPDWVTVANGNGLVPLHLKGDLPRLLDTFAPAILLAPTDTYRMEGSRAKRMKKSTEASRAYLEQCRKAVAAGSAQPALAPALVVHACSGEEADREALVAAEMGRRISDAAATLAASHAPPILSLVTDLVIDSTARLQAEAQLTCPTAGLLKGPILGERAGTAIICRGALDPDRIVALATGGAGDIFESTFATNLADQGKAIAIEDDLSWSVIDLGEDRFFGAFAPLGSSTCRCIACHGPDRTSRAYVHHLVRTKEMLAQVFLASHNLWQYGRLFALLRRPEEQCA